MATGWLKGTVKAVTSGDCLLIMGNVKSGPPPEKAITLSSLIAPRLARRDTKDEPFAWESREFLRKKCIGKEVTFRVDYSVPAIAREFGSVFLGDVNVALAVVAEGWARVRQPVGTSTDHSPYMTELLQVEEQAQTQGLGLWNKTPGAADAAVRKIPPSALSGDGTFDARGFLEENKGKSLSALVEQVRDGSTLRVWLLPGFQFVQVYVCGIQCPSMGRRAAAPAAAAAEAAPVPGADGQNGADASTGLPAAGGAETVLTSAQRLAASGTGEVQPEPFAREGKHFTEVRVLHRDVRIVLEGMDSYNNLFGSVFYNEGGEATDLALQLASMGLAKVVEWSARMLEDTVRLRLKSAELKAKKEQVRMWTGFVPPTSNSTAIRNDNFRGRVVEVVSGDVVVVLDETAGVERRVNLSSIRSPKMGNPRRNEKPEPYAREAKECLRQRLIGQTVTVSMEYTRKVVLGEGAVPGAPPPPGAETRLLEFGSIFLGAKGTAVPVPAADAENGAENGLEKGVTNVAELMLARGLASLIRHRDFEERSQFYDSLQATEQRAIKGKKGMHSGKEPPAAHVNDLSVAGSAAKARQFLPYLQRSVRFPAVVDFVLSGHRFKLLVPKEGVAIAFSLSGVRCPGRDEPFADEALMFMRRRLTQRDVEVEVEAVDKTGTFLGTLWEGKQNASLALLEAGLAKLHPNFQADRVTGASELQAAEDHARAQKRKVWEKDVAPAPVQPGSELAGGAKKAELMDVRVTEVLGCGRFYIQVATDPRMQEIEAAMEGLRVSSRSPPGFAPKKGDIVGAHFLADNSWARAMVTGLPAEAGAGQYQVFYVDYGNVETVPISRLHPLEAGPATGLPPLGQLCTLAYVKVPELDGDFGVEAAEFLSAAVMGKTLKARVEERSVLPGRGRGQGTGPCLAVTLVDVGTGTSVNAAMLASGFARLERASKRDNRERAEALKSLEEHQAVARTSRLNMWQYGDVESDDENPPLPAARKGGR